MQSRCPFSVQIRKAWESGLVAGEMDWDPWDGDRVWWLRKVSDGRLTGTAGTRRIGVTARHSRRLLRGYWVEGDGVLWSTAYVGRPSNRAPSREKRERRPSIATEPIYADFGPTLLSEHLESGYRLPVNPCTLRRWMPGPGSAAAGARSTGGDIATGTRRARRGNGTAECTRGSRTGRQASRC